MIAKEAVLAALKEVVLPELQFMKQELGELKTANALTNKRLDDINAHLIDQSRRIDETNKRIDDVKESLTARIDAAKDYLTTRLDEMNKRIDGVKDSFASRLDDLRTTLAGRYDETNKRLDTLFEVVVRREEHQDLSQRVTRLEQELGEIKQRLAA